MFSLYRVNLYKVEKNNEEYNNELLDNVIIQVVPEDNVFNMTHEFYTGTKISILPNHDKFNKNIVDIEGSKLYVLKKDINKANKIKLFDLDMDNYIDYIEESSFNNYIEESKQYIKK